MMVLSHSKQTVAHIATHLPVVLVELTMLYVGPLRQLGVEAAALAGNYEMCLHDTTHTIYGVGKAVDGGWPAIVDLLLGRLQHRVSDYQLNICMKHWLSTARENNDHDTTRVLVAHEDMMLARWAGDRKK